MTTIKKEIKIKGNGLMKNKPCELTLFPSNSGKIRYFVKDRDSFTADVDNVLSTDHCVVLGNKKAKAMLTEHLSAALAFCGVDSVDICMDEEEVPILMEVQKIGLKPLKKQVLINRFLQKINIIRYQSLFII